MTVRGRRGGLTLGARAAGPRRRGEAAATTPAVDPDAISALHKMGAFLREQQMFAVQAR